LFVWFPPGWCCKQRWLPLPDRARFLAEEDKFGDASSVIVTPLNIMLGDGTLTRSVDLTTVCCSPVGFVSQRAQSTCTLAQRAAAILIGFTRPASCSAGTFLFQKQKQKNAISSGVLSFSFPLCSWLVPQPSGLACGVGFKNDRQGV
jgi:hypothetical protein